MTSMSAFAGCGHGWLHAQGGNGPQAASRAAKKIGIRARHAAPTAIGCRASRRRSLMRRREFIAGLGSAAAWPLAAWAQQPALPTIGFLSGLTESAAGPYASA